MKITFIISFILLLGGCHQNNSKIITNSVGETIKDRILAPDGYEWIIEEENSFGEFLQYVKVKKQGSKILDFNNQPINNQAEHVAILNYDVGKRDLQQCADAVIRLNAEYLYEQKKFDQIKYHFTSGDIFKWDDYKQGIRPKIEGSSNVIFVSSTGYDDSYGSFRRYLDIVFMYAGTISLNKETSRVTDNNKIKSGDILVTPGSPGHAVIIVGRAKNQKGKIIYLLAQGYTPAQSIHVLTNPYDGNLNPWYELDVTQSPTKTARYTFVETNIRSF